MIRDFEYTGLLIKLFEREKIIKPYKPELVKQFQAALSWTSFVIGRGLKRRAHSLKQLFVRPQPPQNSNGEIFIHLGCGDIDVPGFINVDACPAPHVHYVRDVCDLSVFPDNYADLVYACHLLEHIKPEKLTKVLWEWKRILKAGGVLRISVPDFNKLLVIYEAYDMDIESIKGPLLGRWDGYNSHCMIFNYKSLNKAMSDVGFVDIHEWDPEKVDHHDFEDWASRYIKMNGTEFPISLNVEATKLDTSFSAS